MKVFISWSGERSKQMAAALKEWLPTAIQYLEPWMSDTDIHAGDRWADKMATELKESNVGIVCVTGENLTSEWLHFEAGALSKLMQNTRVITVLLDLDVQAVSGPLTLFQMKKLDKGGVLDIAISLNKFAEHKLDEATLNNAVNGMWTSLEQKIKAIPAADKTTKQVRSQGEVLEDLVMDVRSLRNQIEELNDEPDELRHPRDPMMRAFRHPMLMRDLVGIGNDNSPNNALLALLMLAGFARKEMPWLSELLIEFYREFKVAQDSGERIELVMRLKTLLRDLQEHPLFRRISLYSKMTFVTMNESLWMLDEIFDRLLNPEITTCEGGVVTSEESPDEEI